MLGQEQVVFCGYTIFNLEVREEHEHACMAAQRIRLPRRHVVEPRPARRRLRWTPPSAPHVHVHEVGKSLVRPRPLPTRPVPWTSSCFVTDISNDPYVPARVLVLVLVLVVLILSHHLHLHCVFRPLWTLLVRATDEVQRGPWPTRLFRRC